VVVILVVGAGILALVIQASMAALVAVVLVVAAISFTGVGSPTE
jgi:hypothetical protein